ncbi:MAG: PIN domain-containing protein [Deltaproteobacteria bacterium]|nr:MAG: PIN domain-containing protein [Deltaproteobacteria bacterium]
MIAVDTNLLVYAHRAQTAEHTAAKRAIELAAGNPGGWGIPLQCISEFWAVVTHPRAAGRPSEPEEAAGFIRALVETGGAAILEPGSGFAGRLLAAAKSACVSGARIFDLQISLTALEAGASELWTHDRHFVSVPGLKIHDPLVRSRRR